MKFRPGGVPPTNCRDPPPGPSTYRARAPAAPAHVARCPPTYARGPQTRPQLTRRWRLDRRMGWGARRGHRAVLKLWAGTARPPSSLSVVRSLLPTNPSFPRSRLPGRDVRGRERGVGGAAGGGWGTPERRVGAFGAPPAPARLSALSRQVWGGISRGAGESARPYGFPARSPLLSSPSFSSPGSGLRTAFCPGMRRLFRTPSPALVLSLYCFSCLFWK